MNYLLKGTSKVKLDAQISFPEFLTVNVLLEKTSSEGEGKEKVIKHAMNFGSQRPNYNSLANAKNMLLRCPTRKRHLQPNQIQVLSKTGKDGIQTKFLLPVHCIESEIAQQVQSHPNKKRVVAVYRIISQGSLPSKTKCRVRIGDVSLSRNKCMKTRGVGAGMVGNGTNNVIIRCWDSRHAQLPGVSNSIEKYSSVHT